MIREQVVAAGNGPVRKGLKHRDAGHEHLASPTVSTVMGVPFRTPATGA